MVKRYYLNSTIDDKAFDKFLKFQNDITDEKFEVWLNSNGGDCITGEMFKQVFESYSEEQFQLVGTEKLYSCALDLFVTVKCKKLLIPGTIGMIHTSSNWVKINNSKELRLKYSEEKSLDYNFPMMEEMDKKLPDVLTVEELERYKNNEDIYLTTNDILKFLT